MERARVLEIFWHAASLAGAQRSAFLDEACAGDAALRREVERLLAAGGEARDGQRAGRARRAIEAAAQGLAAPAAGECIDGFRLTRPIGDGGMGVVFEAEQLSTGRRVALKLLARFGADPAQVARFEREVEVLARLDHPGIVRVLAAGSYEDAFGPRPWFAMDLVEGRELGAWVRSAPQPALPARLELVARLADAVDHAHRRGCIHRDLKPSNVLVDDQGAPHVLDFGIARLFSEQDRERALTRTGELFGTLAYMSPEQLAGGAVELRSDVYALGIVAYELVTGRLPHAPEVTPSAIARRAVAPPPRLGRAFGRDLETVLAKALEPDPERRYATAGEFAADLRRTLAREPIRARPAGLARRAWLWSRRRPVAAALLAVVLVGLVPLADWAARRGDAVAYARLRAAEELEEELALGFLLLGEGELRRAREQFEGLVAAGATPEALAGLALARLRAGESEAVLALWDEHRALPAWDAALGWIEVDALDRTQRAAAARALEARLAGTTGALADFLRGTLELERGAATGRREGFVAAAGLLRRAVLGLRRPRGLYHFQLAHALCRAADAGGAAEVAEVLEALWPDSALAAYWSGCCRRVAGDHQRAVVCFERALARSPRLHDARGMLGNALAELGRLEEAAGCHLAVLEHLPGSSTAAYNLALVREAQGRYDEALPLLERALEARPGWGAAERSRAIALSAAGRLAEARASAERAVELDARDALSAVVLGSIHLELEDHARAVQVLRRALELDPSSRDATRQLLSALLLRGELDEAERIATAAVERWPRTAFAHETRGVVRWARCDWSGALDDFETCLALGGPQERSVEFDRMLGQSRQLVERLDEILAGELMAPAPEEALMLAWGCYEHEHYDASARYFAAALELDSELREVSPMERYNAACSAVLAACGAGRDGAALDPERRAELRSGALGWLRADLARLEEESAAGGLAASELATTLDHWLADEDLACSRAAAAGGEWAALWSDVRALRASLDG